MTLCFFEDYQYHLYEFDKIGAEIWGLCDGIATADEIAEATSNTISLGNSKAEETVSGFLSELRRRKLVYFKDQNGMIVQKHGKESYGRKSNNDLYFRYLGALHRFPKRPELPLEAIIEVTRKCNRKCAHCYVEIDGRAELSLSQFKIVLDNLSNAGVMIIHFTGGEPFLRKDFLELLVYARQKNMRVHFDTNATMLDAATLEKVAGLDIDMMNVGFDGSTDKVYGIVRNREDFQRVIDNIRLAVDNKIEIMLAFCLHRSNIADLFRLLRLAGKLGVKKLSVDPYQPLNKGSGAKEQFYLSWAVRVLVKMCAFWVSKLVGSTTVYWDKRCNMGLVTFGVHPDGTVSPCVAINRFCGSALTGDIIKIWNNNLFNEYINSSSYGEPCSHCFLPALNWVKKRYLGKCPLDCRAEVFTDTGDILGGNKQCIVGKILRRRRRSRELEDQRRQYPFISEGVNGRPENQGLLLSFIKKGHFRYYTLNKTAGIILTSCSGGNSIFDIASSISEKYGLNNRYASSVVKKFLRKIANEEIIIISKHRRDSPLSLLPVASLSEPGIRNFITPAFKKITPYEMMSKDFKRLASPLEVFVRLLPFSSTEKIKKIIDRIADARVLEIRFSGKYATAREDIVNLVQYAKSKGLKVSLYVKYGNLLNADKIGALKEVGLDLVEFALDGVYHWMQGEVDEDSFRVTVENIKIAVQQGLSSIMVCVANQINIKHLSDLSRLAKEAGVERISVAFFKPDKNENAANSNRALYFNFWGRRYLEIKVRIFSFISPLEIKILTTCAAGVIRCSVDSEGYAAPCVKLPPFECGGLFGNIFQQDLKEIWNSPNFKKFINPREYGRPCSLCPVPYLPFLRSLPRCRADCRRVNYLENNDIFAGNQNCAVGKILKVFINSSS